MSDILQGTGLFKIDTDSPVEEVKPDKDLETAMKACTLLYDTPEKIKACMGVYRKAKPGIEVLKKGKEYYDKGFDFDLSKDSQLKVNPFKQNIEYKWKF